MDQMQVAAYLNWMRERGITHPQISATLPSSEKILSKANVVVFCQAYEESKEQWLPLFKKMLAAIGLEDSKIEYSDFSEGRAGDLNLVFGKPPKGQSLGSWDVVGEARIQYTYHPHILLKVPELKKAAWVQLQNFAHATKNQDTLS